jgi:hypothetical protein
MWVPKIQIKLANDEAMFPIQISSRVVWFKKYITE